MTSLLHTTPRQSSKALEHRELAWIIVQDKTAALATNTMYSETTTIAETIGFGHGGPIYLDSSYAH